VIAGIRSSDATPQPSPCHDRQVLIDAALVGRLEMSAAASSAHIADVMVAARVPGSQVPSPWCGGMLIALGPGRYINRAVGIGAAEVSPQQLQVAEDYFAVAGVPSMVEVSSWASKALVTTLGDRRYRPLWTRNVFARGPSRAATDVGEARSTDVSVVVRVVDDELVGTWKRVLADGNGLVDVADRAVSDEFASARYQVPDSPVLLAFVDGVAVGCGSIEFADGVAWLGGAATLPASRGQGVQTALLRERTRLAHDRGCQVIAASALPNGASARNLSRHGFSLIYTQTEFVRRD
jgi:GNAT superfamily N-acetyltransferase